MNRLGFVDYETSNGFIAAFSTRVEATGSALATYRAWLTATRRCANERDPLAHLDELAGRDLACWCPLDQPCHADVLLEIANGSMSCP